MGLVRWFRSIFSRRQSALAHYRAGMTKAAKHDYRGAIASYSAAIEAADTPLDVKAMAIYNRALAYSASHEGEKAAEDLETVLAMAELPERVRAAARKRRERVRRRDTGEEKRQ